MDEHHARALVKLVYLTPGADRQVVRRGREILYDHFTLQQIVEMWVAVARGQKA